MTKRHTTRETFYILNVTTNYRLGRVVISYFLWVGSGWVYELLGQCRSGRGKWYASQLWVNCAPWPTARFV